MRNRIFLTLFFLFLGVLSFSFGKNKINYKSFKWFVKESEHFTIYYYEEGDERLIEVIDILESAYKNHSAYFQTELKGKTPIILYKTSRDFQQTNILPGFIPPQVQGFAEYFLNRLVVPIDSPNEDLRALLWHELTHIFQYHIFRQSLLSRAPPMWYMEGTAEHLSQYWDMKGKMVLRDAVMNNTFYTLSEMENFYYLPNIYQCYKQSQSFIDWFVENYGVDGLRKLTRQLKRPIQGNYDQVFKRSVGLTYKQVNDKWHLDLKRKYWPKIKDHEEPEADYGSFLLYDVSAHDIWIQPVFFPSGATLAAITSKNGQLDIYIVDSKGEKTIKRLTRSGHNVYEYLLVDENSMDISPDGRNVAIFAYDGRSEVLLTINIFTKKVKKHRFKDVLKPRHPHWKSNNEILFTADHMGGRNIYLYDLTSKDIEQITVGNSYINYVNYDDISGMLYYSKRTAGKDKIFSFDTNYRTEKQLTFGEGNDIEISISYDGNRILFTSDRYEDIPNLYIYDVEKRETRRITNTIGGNFMARFSPDSEKIAFTSYYNGMYRTYVNELKDFKVYETIKEEYEHTEPVQKDFTSIKFLKNVKDYRLKLYPTNVSSYITYENGVIQNYSNITFSDILGDINLGLNIDAIRQFNNFYLYFINRSRRLNWGAMIYNIRNDYYFGFLNEYGYEGEYGLSLSLIYPTSKYRRFEFDVDWGEYYWSNIFQSLYGYPEFKRKLFFKLNFVSDTTRYGFFAHNSGERYFISFGGALPLGESYFESYRFIVDYRKYIKLTFRSTLAFRAFGYTSFGKDKYYIYLGGIGSIRGYDPMTIWGNNAVMTNLELRIPLIDIIRISGLFNFYFIRGLLFVDVGNAWMGNDFVPFKNEDGSIRFNDLKGSVGAGLRFRLGYFDLMFDFAKRWDLARIYKTTHFNFNIGFDY